jgi:rod shape-determining protein MreC
VADFDRSRRKERGRGLAWALGVVLLALVVFVLPEATTAPLRDGLRRTAMRPFIAIQARLAGLRAGAADLVEIRAQRDSLVALVAAQAALADENRRLRAALGLGERLGPRFIPAQVLRLGVAGAESTFLVDVGAAAGVRAGSPVLSPEGLIGVVWVVDGRMAQAIDWTHPDFRVSAMTADGEAYGIVEPRRGRHREEDLLVLTGAPFHSDIRPGRRIVTSGRGALYPRGVPVGTVIGIDQADTGWRKSYLVRPAARPEGLLHVFVGIESSSRADLSTVWDTGTAADTVVASPAAAPGPGDAPPGAGE